MTGCWVGEAAGEYNGNFQINNQDRTESTAFHIEGTWSSDRTSEHNEGYLSNSLSHKRKSINLPGSCKRQRIGRDTPVSSNEENIHRNSQIQIGKQSSEFTTAIPTQAQLHCLPEVTQVKVKYIIAEKEVRRERAENGRASKATIAALTSAGERMRVYLDHKVEAVRMYWEHEVDDLIASEKAMVTARQLTPEDSARSQKVYL